MELNFSTHAADTAHRFAYWSDVVCSHFIPAASTVPCRDDFDACLSVRPLGSLTLARMSSPAHAWERTAQHLRTGPNDDFMLSLMVSGQGRLSQSGRWMVQRAGDIALYDAARPFTYELEPESFLLLRIPRRRLLALVPDAERLTATPLSEGSSVAMLLASMMREAAVLEFSGHEGAQGPLANSLLDMLAVVLQMRQDGPSAVQSPHDALFRVLAHRRHVQPITRGECRHLARRAAAFRPWRRENRDAKSCGKLIRQDRRQSQRVRESAPDRRRGRLQAARYQRMRARRDWRAVRATFGGRRGTGTMRVWEGRCTAKWEQAATYPLMRALARHCDHFFDDNAMQNKKLSTE